MPTATVLSVLAHLLLIFTLFCVSSCLPSSSTDTLTAAPAEAEPSYAATESTETLPRSSGEVEKRHASTDHTDTRWRMISAMLVLNDYSMVMTHRYSAKPDLIVINNQLPTHVLLDRIMERVCNLVSFHQLALQINDTTDRVDFYPLLSEVISDSCKWIHYLANFTDSMTLNEDELSLESNSSYCSGDEVTLLHHYCYRVNIGHLLGMMDIESFALHSYISEYHRNDVPHVPAADFSRWLNTTSLLPGVKNAIHDNTVMAILQYIVETKLL